ncbi:MAG TPA: transposase [Thermoanaerobaculia bacterium]|jgi:REP element-mobilizing transposase RayT|nr:transposase [Thermoanaerobaculia bacterium]
MARRLRYIPAPRTLVFITCRTVQGRFLFRPGSELNDLVLGVLGRCQRNYDLTLCAVTVLSSHLHLLAVVDDARQISGFMRDLKSKLAREVNRLTGWKGHVFERRYDMAVVTEEEGAQIGRLAYILAHGVKEDLVERVRDWPGVQSARALLDGEPLTGQWFDRTREFAERNLRQPIEPLRFATKELVVLSPIPCWAHLPKDVYRARVASLVESIEWEAALRRSQTGRSVIGVKAILAKDPQHRPTELARSPAPLLHAVSKAARKAFYEAYSWFVAAFRTAAEALKAGDRSAPFPAGSFPPALPFVAG